MHPASIWQRRALYGNVLWHGISDILESGAIIPAAASLQSTFSGCTVFQKIKGCCTACGLSMCKAFMLISVASFMPPCQSLWDCAFALLAAILQPNSVLLTIKRCDQAHRSASGAHTCYATQSDDEKEVSLGDQFENEDPGKAAQQEPQEPGLASSWDMPLLYLCWEALCWADVKMQRCPVKAGVCHATFINMVAADHAFSAA